MRVVRKILPYKNIETVEHIESPLSSEMTNAMNLWYDMYLNQSPWLSEAGIVSLNLPGLICSEIARGVTIEMKCNITGPADANGEKTSNPRAIYLAREFEKLMTVLRSKLEQGCAAGGMAIKPYPRDGHIYFDFNMAWGLYPIAFGDDSVLTDVIFRDSFTEGKTVYTRLERHTVSGSDVKITQRAFKSETRDALGIEIPLSSVDAWQSLVPEAVVKDSEGPLFGWFKTASANSIDVDSPMGVSVYSKAVDSIREADKQYSRLLWEFEGSELAVDVDPSVLRPKKDGKGQEMPKLNQRLFRGVDLGTDDNYHVFNPAIRDASLVAGLNQILIRVEDLCGLARGTLTDVNQEARTATEIRHMRQRTYVTIADNQKVLEHCLRDVIRTMDKYATIYHLAPQGEYEVSFDWDDSVLNDTSQQLAERLELHSAGLLSDTELRQWYFGETEAQAAAAMEKLRAEQLSKAAAMIPGLNISQ